MFAGKSITSLKMVENGWECGAGSVRGLLGFPLCSLRAAMISTWFGIFGNRNLRAAMISTWFRGLLGFP